MGTFSYNMGRCDIITNDGSRCGKVMTGAGRAVAAHNAMHLHAGELIKVYKWSWKGEPIESQVIAPRDKKAYERANWFTTFERCKAAYLEAK